MIFFSHNYLCKSIPGCAGSGVFKNVTTDLRDRILDKMEKDGLIKSGLYLSATRAISYVKLPPNAFRQSQSLLKLFHMLGPSLTMNIYGKMFETFGLVTASDAAIVPVAPAGVKLLRETDSFVEFYHCLDKDVAVRKMIEERIVSKELRIVRQHTNASYRYELVAKKEDTVGFSNSNAQTIEAGEKKQSIYFACRNTLCLLFCTVQFGEQGRQQSKSLITYDGMTGIAANSNIEDANLQSNN